MNYEQLKEVLTSERQLPINRKERFYTGTILPSLLFHGGLSNLYSFLRQIKGLPNEINEENTKDAFLFYTEYNLKESAGKKSVGAEIYTANRDTPDVIIQILKPVTVFIVIEAKMFSNLSQNNFNLQMRAQKKSVIDVLYERYHCPIFHVALVPSQLGFIGNSYYEIVNWQFFIDNKEINLEGNHFADYLRFALEHYNKLVSNRSRKAETVQEEMSGAAIDRDGKMGIIYWVGRQGGRTSIEQDVRMGVWRKKLYGINAKNPRNGREGNWLTSIDFANIISTLASKENK